MRTLIINSYAGSIMLGARALGAEIIGSYEDSNFGLDIQKANVPGLDYRPYRRDWPKQDLSKTIVLAHPPCSAFSVQNCSPTARGVNSDAFACTKVVLQYAVDNNALAIAIESVMGALGGAWNQHQRYADDYGYNLYRIVENGCMFGCQWRERFWVLFIKKGAAPDTLHLELTPKFQTVNDVTGGYEDGRSAGNQDILLERQKARLIEEAGLSAAEMSFLFDVQDPPHKTTALGTVLFNMKYKTAESKPSDRWEVFKKYIGGFASGTMVYLDPNGLSPVLMGGSHWYMNGRNVSETAFKRIMGFPADYIFPESPRNYRTQMRMYLSKGVMPPIAEWILEQATLHLGWKGQARSSTDPNITPYRLEVEPDQIADFRIYKDAWFERHQLQPELKQFDDRALLKMGEDDLNTEQRRVLGSLVELLRNIDTTSDVSSAITLACNSLEAVLNPPLAPVPEKPIKVKITREPKVQVERPQRPPRDTTIRTSRFDDMVLVIAVDGELEEDLPPMTKKKRQLMLQIARGLEQATWSTMLAACLAHPELQILPTTMTWHLRQIMKTSPHLMRPA